jgi:hypothetical protein
MQFDERTALADFIEMQFDGELTADALTNFIQAYDFQGVNWGLLDGETFLIFEGWSAVHELTGLLNGFTGYKTEPHIPEGASLADLIAEAKAEAIEDPDHYGKKRRVQELVTHLLYKQHLHTLGHDPISIEDFGVEYGFSDEWDLCADCQAVIRTSPDSYGWTAPLYVEAEGYICDDCVKKGGYDDYIADEFKNVAKSIPDAVDLNRLALVKLNDKSLENGFHHGMMIPRK